MDNGCVFYNNSKNQHLCSVKVAQTLTTLEIRGPRLAPVRGPPLFPYPTVSQLLGVAGHPGLVNCLTPPLPPLSHSPSPCVCVQASLA